MKKFTSKTKKKKKRFFLLIFFLLVIYFILEKVPHTLNNQLLANFLLENAYQKKRESMIVKVVKKSVESLNPIKLVEKEKPILTEEVIEVEEEKPKVYIYNTHPSEEYKVSNLLEFSIEPTVIMNDYILKGLFDKEGVLTVVEQTSVRDILNNNHWNYASSYRASRILLEQSIITYPSLKYFIDVHRDSVSRDNTTIQIEDKMYARILFIVGLENPTYQENLSFTEIIHNKINEKYPNLSKGIYQKSGPGVNGVYNQDFNNNTILIEVGGYENTTEEVLNTLIAFSECFLEVIHE